MARYDYQCTKCGSIEEIEHPMTHTPNVTCSDVNCRAPMRRQISSNPVHFKGLGWASNDGKDLFDPPKGIPSKIR